MNKFIDELNLIVEMPIEAQIAINNLTGHRRFRCGDMLLSNGAVCKEFHFIISGLARVFYYKDGKDITAWFAAEGALASAIDSLFTGKPSIYNIELLEDSEVFSFQYSKLDSIVTKFSIVERLGRLLVTQNYLLLDERMKLFVFCTAEEKYTKLMEQQPNVFQRVMLGHIASYIGISQEHLSRIRASYKKPSK